MSAKQQFLMAVRNSIEQQFLQFTDQLPQLKVQLLEDDDSEVLETVSHGLPEVEVLIRLSTMATSSMTFYPRGSSPSGSAGTGSGSGGTNTFICPGCKRKSTVT